MGNEECSICSTELDIEGEGGCMGYIGILPVQFCSTCLNGILDMCDQMQGREFCEECSYPLEESCKCEDTSTRLDI